MRVAATAAIGLIAFLTLVDLFAAQALLPTLAVRYAVSPAAMGVAVNACTFGMAVSGLAMALLSRRVERRRGIWVSLAALSIPTLLLAIAPNLAVFAILRIVQGVFMAAAFALTLAHLGERLDGRSAANGFAAYVTGNVASNLFGRLFASAVADHLGVSAAFILFAGLNLAGAAVVLLAIKPSMRSGQQSPATHWIDSLRSPSLLASFGIGFCILFAFIGTFTYVNFVLVAPPFSLGMMSLGLVYLVFLPAIVTTPLTGQVVRRLGTPATLLTTLGLAGFGLTLVLQSSLSLVAIGLALVGVGTFAAQAAATGHVASAAADRGVASGLYLASYFMGGLVGSAVLGTLYEKFGWAACVAGVGAALFAAALLTAVIGMSRRHGTDRHSAMAAAPAARDAPLIELREQRPS